MFRIFKNIYLLAKTKEYLLTAWKPNPLVKKISSLYESLLRQTEEITEMLGLILEDEAEDRGNTFFRGIEDRVGRYFSRPENLAFSPFSQQSHRANMLSQILRKYDRVMHGMLHKEKAKDESRDWIMESYTEKCVFSRIIRELKDNISYVCQGLGCGAREHEYHHGRLL
ncbi:hypothetical protein JXC34_04600 [Candidatus Woesearchaeota archaeon]|nr:hypothetical protein [Candidatus Woesearchaeota archaeon]